MYENMFDEYIEIEEIDPLEEEMSFDEDDWAAMLED